MKFKFLIENYLYIFSLENINDQLNKFYQFKVKIWSIDHWVNYFSGKTFKPIQLYIQKLLNSYNFHEMAIFMLFKRKYQKTFQISKKVFYFNQFLIMIISSRKMEIIMYKKYIFNYNLFGLEFVHNLHNSLFTNLNEKANISHCNFVFHSKLN